MNPFANSTPSATPGATQKMTDTLAAAANSTRDGLTTFGASARTAMGKTTDAVASVFTRNEAGGEQLAEDDPLSLQYKPEKVNANVFIANGQLWESTGDMNKAMESYQKALESEPDSAPALTSIARLNFRQGKFVEAAESYGKAIELNANDAGLHYELGLTQSKLNNRVGATKSLETALQLAPGTSRYANNLATVKFEGGDANSAYQVLVTNNKPAVAHFNMAYLYFKNGQMNQAKTHLAEAIRFEPQAASDATIKRAVSRSREMLAQIDASMAPVAQAAPQAAVASGSYFGASQPTSVRQASQSGSPTANSAVAPAAQTTPPYGGPSFEAATPGLPQSKASPAVAPRRPMPIRPSVGKADPATVGTVPTGIGSTALPTPVNPGATAPAAPTTPQSSSNGFEMPTLK